MESQGELDAGLNDRNELHIEFGFFYFPFSDRRQPNSLEFEPRNETATSEKEAARCRFSDAKNVGQLTTMSFL